MSTNDEDLALATRALSGDEQAAKEIYGLRPQLVSYLMSKGAPSVSIAEDVVADFLGECFGAYERSVRATTNRRLEMYKGKGPLIAWLKKSCWNKFVDSIEPETDPLPGDGDGLDSADIRPAPAHVEPEQIARIVAALEYAFSELEPLTLIFLRLVYLEGVSQSDVAAAFNCNDSTVSRRLDQGLAALRQSAESFQQRDAASTEIEWSDLLVICQTPPDFIYEN